MKRHIVKLKMFFRWHLYVKHTREWKKIQAEIAQRRKDVGAQP